MSSSVNISVGRLREAARKRPAGYLDDCLAVGVVSADGKIVSFTTSQYDELTKKYGGSRAASIGTPSRSGPGTELKKLLAKLGIVGAPGCSCNARARRMDENEKRDPGWCEANVDTIVGWLREEATKRKLPFLDAAGRMLVRRAIRNARLAAQAR